MHWGSSIFAFSPLFPHFYFFAHISPPFPLNLLFSRLIDVVIHFEGACYRTSLFPPHFSLTPWISVLGIGCSIPAPMACDLLPRWLERLQTDSSTWNTTKMG